MDASTHLIEGEYTLYVVPGTRLRVGDADGPTNGGTDTLSYNDASAHLKSLTKLERRERCFVCRNLVPRHYFFGCELHPCSAAPNCGEGAIWDVGL